MMSTAYEPHNNQSNIDIRNLLRVVDVEALRSLPPGDPAVVTALQPILENVVYGQLNETSISLLSDKAIAHLVSTLQLSCIHMMSAQASLQRLVDSANSAAKEAREAQAHAESRLASLQHEVKARRRLQRETDTLLSSMTGNSALRSSTLPIPSATGLLSGATVYRCSHCPKAFLTSVFLDSHVSRRHGESSSNLATIVSRKSDYVSEETASLKAEITALRSDLARSNASSESLMSERSNALLHTQSSNIDAAALSVTASAMRYDVNALRLALEQQRIASEERLAERDSRIAELSAENAAIMGGLRSQLQDLEASLLSRIGGTQSSALSGGSPKRRSIKSSSLKAPPSASVEIAADVSNSDSARRFRHKVVILSPRTRSLVLQEDVSSSSSPLKENVVFDAALIDKESIESYPKQTNNLTTQLFSSPLSSKSSPYQIKAINNDAEANVALTTVGESVPVDPESANLNQSLSNFQSINPPMFAANLSKRVSESSNGVVPEVSIVSSSNQDAIIRTSHNATKLVSTTADIVSGPAISQTLEKVEDFEHVNGTELIQNHLVPEPEVNSEKQPMHHSSTAVTHTEKALETSSVSFEDKSLKNVTIITSPNLTEEESKDSGISNDVLASKQLSSPPLTEVSNDDTQAVAPVSRQISSEETSSGSIIASGRDKSLTDFVEQKSNNVALERDDGLGISEDQSTTVAYTQVNTIDEVTATASCGAPPDSELEEGEVEDKINIDGDIVVKNVSTVISTHSDSHEMSMPKSIPVLITKPPADIRDGDARIADVRRAIEVSMRTVFGSLLLPSNTHSLLNFPKRDVNATVSRQRAASATPLVIPAPGSEIKRDFSNITAPSLDESFQTAASAHPKPAANDVGSVKAQEDELQDETKNEHQDETENEHRDENENEHPDQNEDKEVLKNSGGSHLSEVVVNEVNEIRDGEVDHHKILQAHDVLTAVDAPIIEENNSRLLPNEHETAAKRENESNKDTHAQISVTKERDSSHVENSQGSQVVDQSIAQQIEEADDIVEEELLRDEKGAAQPTKGNANEKSLVFDDDDEIESSYAKIVAQERMNGYAHDADTDIEIEDM